MHNLKLFFLFLSLILIDSCSQNSSNENNTQTNTDNNKSLYFKEAFHLRDQFNQRYKLSLENEKVLFTTHKPLVIIHLYPPSAKLSLSQINTLNTLEKKYTKKILSFIFLDKPLESLKVALPRTKEVHYINKNTITNYETLYANLTKNLKRPLPSFPLSIIYLKGKYFTHYEGDIPIEMLEYDIQEAQRILKTKQNESEGFHV